METIRVLTSEDDALWHEYLSRLPLEQQDIYFTPEYYKLYEEEGDGSARCFVFQQGEDVALYPFLINNINVLGYELDKDYYDIQGAYGYNGIISSSYDSDFIKNFHDAFYGYISDNDIVCEFVRFHPILENVRFSDGFMETIYDRKTVFLDFQQGYESIWQNQYSSNNRNMIRKSLKSEVVCSIEDTVDYIDDFKNIYIETMKKLSADEEYFFGEKYFSSFADEMSKYSKIVVCKSDDKVLAASLMMHYGKYVHYHLSGRSKHCRDNFINNQMLDTAIKQFISDNENSVLHFGGGRSNAVDDSLLKFKRNFSKQKGDFYIGKKIHNSEIYNIVVNQWQEKHPKAASVYKRLLQKYRKLDN